VALADESLREPQGAWLSVSGWCWTLALFPFGIIFLTRYFTWPLILCGFLYSMVGIGTQGAVWLHRYSTHRAFKFRNAAYRFVCRHLAIKIERYYDPYLVATRPECPGAWMTPRQGRQEHRIM
jgi:stearoyl-CoA desaturase (delta-9 desaturase)